MKKILVIMMVGFMFMACGKTKDTSEILKGEWITTNTNGQSAFITFETTKNSLTMSDKTDKVNPKQTYKGKYKNNEFTGTMEKTPHDANINIILKLIGKDSISGKLFGSYQGREGNKKFTLNFTGSRR